MLQPTTLSLTSLLPTARAGGSPMATTSDFALALADLAGGPGVAPPTGVPVAVPGGVPAIPLIEVMPTRPELAGIGKALPPRQPDDLLADIVAVEIFPAEQPPVATPMPGAAAVLPVETDHVVAPVTVPVKPAEPAVAPESMVAAMIALAVTTPDLVVAEPAVTVRPATVQPVPTDQVVVLQEVVDTGALLAPVQQFKASVLQPTADAMPATEKLVVVPLPAVSTPVAVNPYRAPAPPEGVAIVNGPASKAPERRSVPSLRDVAPDPVVTLATFTLDDDGVSDDVVMPEAAPRKHKPRDPVVSLYDAAPVLQVAIPQVSVSATLAPPTLAVRAAPQVAPRVDTPAAVNPMTPPASVAVAAPMAPQVAPPATKPVAAASMIPTAPIADAAQATTAAKPAAIDRPFRTQRPAVSVTAPASPAPADVLNAAVPPSQVPQVAVTVAARPASPTAGAAAEQSALMQLAITVPRAIGPAVPATDANPLVQPQAVAAPSAQRPAAIPPAAPIAAPAVVGAAPSVTAQPAVMPAAPAISPPIDAAVEAARPVARPDVTTVALPAATPAPPRPAEVLPAAQMFAQAMFAAPAAVARDGDDARPEPLSLSLASGIAATGGAPVTPAAVSAADAAQGGALDMTRGEWMTSMIDRIETLRDESGAIGETRLKLSPDALGNVDVSVRRDESGQYQVRIAADTAQARTILADAAPRLTDMAEARGLKLSHAGVETGTGANPGFADSNRRDAQQSAPAPRRPASVANDAGTASDPITQDTRIA